MKPPKVLQIGPHAYKVSVSAKKADLSGVDYGVTHASRTEIVLHPSISASQARDTLLHEVLHAIFEQLGVKVGPEPLLESDDEERLIWTLAPMLLDTLRRNPALVEFLLV